MSNKDYPPLDIRISNLITSLKEVGFNLEDADTQKQVQQVIQDMVISTTISTIVNKDTWVTLTERAEQLGWRFDSTQQKKMLSRFVSRKGRISGYVNLRQRISEKGCLYTSWLLTPELDKAISEFFTVEIKKYE